MIGVSLTARRLGVRRLGLAHSFVAASKEEGSVRILELERVWSFNSPVERPRIRQSVTGFGAPQKIDAKPVA
jgi:hypothetical protein